MNKKLSPGTLAFTTWTGLAGELTLRSYSLPVSSQFRSLAVQLLVKVGNGSVLHQGLLETGWHVHMEFMCTTLLTSIMTGSSLSYVHHSRQTQLYISGHTVHIDIENYVTFTSYNHYFNHTEFDPQLITDIFTVLFYRWCLRRQPPLTIECTTSVPLHITLLGDGAIVSLAHPLGLWGSEAPGLWGGRCKVISEAHPPGWNYPLTNGVTKHFTMME